MASGSYNLTSDKARILSTQPGTDKFWRGDNSWSDTFDGVLLLPQGLKTGTRVNDTGSGIEIGTDGGIEIFHTSTPFIDFHYQASTADYSVRLICDSATSLKCIGTVNADGFTIYNTGANHWRNGYLKVNKSDGGDCYIEICRAANADWRILNSGGYLHFQCNWDSAKGSYYNVLQLEHTSGNVNVLRGNIVISHATSADMAHNSSNPKITFSENGSQPVYLIYTDYDSYRSPAGLKVVGGSDASPAWFEVEGQIYGARFNGPVTGNVTGNCSGSAGSVAWGNVTGKPSTFPPSSHAHGEKLNQWNQGTGSTNAVIVTHNSTGSDSGRGQCFAFGNGNGVPWFTEIQYGVSYVRTIRLSNGMGATHFISATQFAIISTSWDGVTICQSPGSSGAITAVATASGNYSANGTNYRAWIEGNSVTGAVWNDYAENREAIDAIPGQCVYEIGDDTLKPTTERLSHFAGIVSDTWGFSQGETETAKSPIAVAGRVLAYTYRCRDEYKSGDVLCAAPGGTVDIMTREEIQMYPDRIVGTVSCVPDYETWGGGDMADREPVEVDGRIWVKVK